MRKLNFPGKVVHAFDQIETFRQLKLIESIALASGIVKLTFSQNSRQIEFYRNPFILLIFRYCLLYPS